MTTSTVNWVATTTGVSAICDCGKRSKPVAAQPDGRPSDVDLTGWACAPYPLKHPHRNGTCGPRYVCRACNRARR